MQRILLLLIPGLVIAPQALADKPVRMDSDTMQRYQALDQNGNGFISLNEVRGKHRIMYYYESADANDDGHIDREEFAAFEARVPPFETP